MKSKVGMKIQIGICLAFAIVLDVFVPVPDAFSVLGSNQVYDLNEQIYGKTHSEWGGEWWTRLQNSTNDTVPANDNTGEKCNYEQTDKNMFFLYGVFGSNDLITRECTIQSSKAIFVPVLGSECSDREDTRLDTPKKRTECVYDGTYRGANVLNFKLDGIPLTNITNYYSETPLNVTLPANNIWGVDPGLAHEYTGGYYVILKPLSVGKHTIDFDAKHLPEPGKGSNIIIKVKYNLNITNSTNN
jgi:hypothetical protein